MCGCGGGGVGVGVGCGCGVWGGGGGGGGGGGHPCLGSRLTFDPKRAQLGSCLDSELASP